jgi:predicted AAA+ superfamily ATPase
LEHPELALESLKGLVVVDEVQRRPELFAALRPLADRANLPARFVLLGSASPGLMRGVSESLAGRAQFITVEGFDLEEVDPDAWRSLWLRGGFPRSFLAADDAASLRWRTAFMTTFLERDLPQLGIRIPAETLRRFWMMVAHYHGQIWNASELARSLGSNEKTARQYLDLLAGAYVVRILPPWFENLGKRLVKSPKVYVRDCGLLHALLDISASSQLPGHVKMGASWEGFAIEQVLARWGKDRAWFWSTYQGAELDLLLEHRGTRYGFEFKYADAPVVTRSMQVALEDLRLEHLWVVYPGLKTYRLSADITVVPITRLPGPP